MQRSETFVVESVVLDDGVDGLEVEASDHPYDIIAYLINEFASTKRNFFGQVSGWLQSDKREDYIDDFAQEMGINGFWSIDKREEIAQALLKNEFHCGMKFYSADELAQHMPTCKYRPRTCQNEGCHARFSASQVEKHDSRVRHCITVCPMKLVNCPFYSVGCKSALTQCKILMEALLSANLEAVNKILMELKIFLSVLFSATIFSSMQKYSTKLANIRDVRCLTYKVKDLDAKVGPLKVGATNKVDEAAMTIAKVEFLEANDTNKFTEKGSGAKAIGFETKDPCN
ncbi:hypothetical protein GQ457_08G016960 [Hibiscus cannabinus]